MGLEEKPPPLPPRNYDWSDVEDNDEDLFQSEDELEEPCFRISLDEQQAMYSSVSLSILETHSSALDPCLNQKSVENVLHMAVQEPQSLLT